jgi:hypothetical protein
MVFFQQPLFGRPDGYFAGLCHLPLKSDKFSLTGYPSNATICLKCSGFPEKEGNRPPHISTTL